MKPKAQDPAVLVIDMKPYLVKVRDYYYGSMSSPNYVDAIPSDVNVGRKIAKDVDLLKRLPDLTRIRVVAPREILLDRPHDSIWKGLFGPAARKIGTQNLKSLIDSDSWDVAYQIGIYLVGEQSRIDAKAKKKAKEEALKNEEAWTDPIRFFLPEIGTILRLSYDWKFTIYQEHRNEKFIDLLNLFDGKCWVHWEDRSGPDTALIQIRAGSELKVDRIYIRKGAEDYSSVTFWLGKEAVVIGPDGKQYAPTKRMRFWAKLSDVNRIQALVNKASVPGLE